MGLRGRRLLGAGFVQHGDLCDRAALREERPPPLAVGQVVLGLPLPEALLQLRLDLEPVQTGSPKPVETVVPLETQTHLRVSAREVQYYRPIIALKIYIGKYGYREKSNKNMIKIFFS